MSASTRFIVLLGAGALVGCQPVASPDGTPDVPSLVLSSISPSSSHTGGAIVLNPGEGKPNGVCFFGPFSADQLSAVRTPNGQAQLSCNFSGLPTGSNAVRITEFFCFINLGGISFTTETIFIATPGGQGQMTCVFPETSASGFTEVFDFPINLSVFVPCAVSGAGEFVDLFGSLHTVFHVTDDGSGGFHISALFSPQGISGVGLTSGDSYQATGGTHFHTNVNGPLPITDTFVNNFRIIGQGPSNNFLVHTNFHITINANGELTAFVDNFSIECK